MPSGRGRTPRRLHESDERAIRLTEQLERLAATNGSFDTSEVVDIEAARLRRFVRQLPKREREVIVLRYGLDGLRLTLVEVARRFALGKSTVFDIEQEALARLRGFYEHVEEAA
jgi:RNA polymerase sigma factor (sigma-70 family)